MHPLYGSLPELYVPVRVTRGAVTAHRCMHLCASSLQRSQYRRNFIPLSVSLWNDLGDSVINGVGLAGLKSRANPFISAEKLAPF